ncbi:MAG: YkgJ family cysteine cluster protein [Treponema sp.]|nr:YkgJ family cysteine cluster protein [Treponema sp.]
MENQTFYVSGLNFSCKRCSACCRHDSGFVFLSENDLENLTIALEMDKDSLLKVYCRWVTDWKGDTVLSLKEKSNKDCILWDDGCTVYEKRPLQCITFPFWESIISSSEVWEITASDCAGINSGKLHTPLEISGFLKARADNPIIIKERGEL